MNAPKNARHATGSVSETLGVHENAGRVSETQNRWTDKYFRPVPQQTVDARRRTNDLFGKALGDGRATPRIRASYEGSEDHPNPVGD